MDIKQLLDMEAGAIDGMFKQNKIYARVQRAKSIHGDPTSGFIRYALTLRPDQSFTAIEKIHRELSAVLTRQRQRMRLPAVQAMPVSEPMFGIEVQHPFPKALHWSPRLLDTTPVHSMLLGRSYESGATNEVFSFDESVHCLVAGITGAGKSVLLQNMLLSLCHATSPDDLKIILVDLKNEDMVAFEHLPHIMTFAGTREQAMDAIRFVVDEKDKRVAKRGYKPYRLVLWIDELAQLADNKEARQALGDLASIGRSKMINLVGATQHPTEAGGLGTMLKANFPLRLVGMVANGQSHIATGRPKLHAELLPGKGAFLRIEGPHVVRFQSFMIDEASLKFGVSSVVQRWRKQKVKPGYAISTVADTAGYEADISTDMNGYAQPYTSENGSPAHGGYNTLFPIRAGRPLNVTEAQAVRRLAESGEFDSGDGFSLRRLTVHVYGSRDPKRTQWIKEALEKVSV